ncbi:MAG: FAD-dependent oxidoreductase [Candidatus Fermentibacteraceae bacterium]|nr:FAD-dependent oxidoreductase [Candidatus Fermentibacteraceae bacterium]
MIDFKTGMVGSSPTQDRELDLVIAGGGPAALAAALYAARYDIEHVVLESYQPGGQAALTAHIENYPGIENITGSELTSVMKRHAESWGAVFEMTSVLSALPLDDIIEVKADSSTYRTRALIIATGAAPSKLGIPGEDKFYGRGVSYCATCDAPFFRGKHVLVVGGGDSAVKEALHLSEFVGKLTLVHRRDKFRAEPYLAEKLLSCPNCEVIWNSTLKSITGNDGVEGVTLITPEGEKDISLDGVFMYVGRKPATEPFKGLVDLNENGTVKTHDIVHTSRNNVFAAGDVTDNELKQVVTAVSDGARAASAVFDLFQ